MIRKSTKRLGGKVANSFLIVYLLEQRIFYLIVKIIDYVILQNTQICLIVYCFKYRMNQRKMSMSFQVLLLKGIFLSKSIHYLFKELQKVAHCQMLLFFFRNILNDFPFLEYDQTISVFQGVFHSMRDHETSQFLFIDPLIC